MEKKERDWERSCRSCRFDVKSVVLVVFRRMDLASNGKKTTLIEENGTYFNLFKCSGRLSR